MEIDGIHYEEPVDPIEVADQLELLAEALLNELQNTADLRPSVLRGKTESLIPLWTARYCSQHPGSKLRELLDTVGFIGWRLAERSMSDV